MDSLAEQIFRYLTSTRRWLWRVIVNVGRDLSVNDLRDWIRTEGVHAFITGWTNIRNGFIWWLVVNFVLFSANVGFIHWTPLWTFMGLVNFFVIVFMLVWSTPLVFFGSAAVSLADALKIDSISADAALRKLTSYPSDAWKAEKARMNGWLHTCVWILLGVTITSAYLHIFQVWNFPSAVPLLIHAVFALILLDGLHTEKEREFRRGRSVRPFLTAVMTGIVVVCTGSFLFPQLAAALRNGLGGVDSFLTLPMVLPLVAFLLVAVPFVAYKRTSPDGKSFERPNLWAKWAVIMLPVLYLEYLGVRWALIDYNLPTMYWLSAAIVVGNLALVGFGMMFKPDKERLGRRALIGHSIVTVALTVLVCFIGFSTKPNYYRTQKVVQPTGVAVVVSDVKVCLVDYEEFRGGKNGYDVCPSHGEELVWFTSLSKVKQDSLRAAPNNKDFPKVDLAQLAKLGGQGGMTAEEWNRLLQGGKP